MSVARAAASRTVTRTSSRTCCRSTPCPPSAWRPIRPRTRPTRFWRTACSRSGNCTSPCSGCEMSPSPVSTRPTPPPAETATSGFPCRQLLRANLQRLRGVRPQPPAGAGGAAQLELSGAERGRARGGGPGGLAGLVPAASAAQPQGERSVYEAAVALSLIFRSFRGRSSGLVVPTRNAEEAVMDGPGGPVRDEGEGEAHEAAKVRPPEK